MTTPNWEVVDASLIARECSPRHVQSVIEDAQRDIAKLLRQRDELLDALREYEALLTEGLLNADTKRFTRIRLSGRALLARIEEENQ
jgi:hypothetical protein